MLLFDFASLVGGQAGSGTTIADIHIKMGVITAPEILASLIGTSLKPGRKNLADPKVL
jgi:hypothetical protein